MPSNFSECFRHAPKLQYFEQKQRRLDIAQDMLATFNEDPEFHKKIMTGDESWLYGYDIEIKAKSFQSKRPEEPRPKKAHQVRSNVKDLLPIFFHCNGVVHHEFLPQGRTVNKEYYLEVRRRLRKAIRENGGKINHGFYTMITHQLIHRCLCVSFWPKTKP